MRTGLTGVYDADGIRLGDHVDTWENDDGSVAYEYDSVTIDSAETPTGARKVGSATGAVERGALVRVENIPMGHRKHTHRQWAVGPVEGIWAVPRKQVETESGTETVELDAAEFDPDTPGDRPGVSVVCEVYAPRLGGDVPLARCQPLSEPPQDYVARYGDERVEGLWVNEPIRKQEKAFNNEHLPDPDEDGRESEYIGTDGGYDTLVEMRGEMRQLPASDGNAPDDNPETDRVFEARVRDDRLNVVLFDGSGEERMREVVARHGADAEHVETVDNDGFVDGEKMHYRITVDASTAGGD